MLKHILTFVLVVLMVKTNAQTAPYYYCGSNPFSLNETDDLILLQWADTLDSTKYDSLMAYIGRDPNFDYYTLHAAGFVTLKRKTGNMASKATALGYYASCPLLSYASFAFYDGSTTDNGYWGVGNEILAKPSSTTTTSQIASVAATNGVLSYAPDDIDPEYYHFFVPKTSNTIDIANAMYLSGYFDYAEPNFFLAVHADGPNYGKSTTSNNACNYSSFVKDPKWTDRSEWGLYNNSLNSYYVYPHGQNFADINICNSWNSNNGSRPDPYIADGTGILVAVIDDGVDVLHQDLGNYINGYDLYANNGSIVTPLYAIPGAPDQISHHGTQCAGIIAAKQNNPTSSTAIGMTGVAFNATIMPIRAAAWSIPDRNTTGFTQAAMSGAINYAYNHGADVISNSWSQPLHSPISSTVNLAIENAVTYGRGGTAPTCYNCTNGILGKGCVVVFSAGNDNSSYINWPSSYPKVIAVGAMNMCNERKRNASDPQGISCDNETAQNWGSNYGFGLYFGHSSTAVPTDSFYAQSGYLSVTAPGVHIFTTDFAFGYPSYHYNTDFWGTSAACPHVSGVAALILQVNPCLTSAEVKQIIELSATKVNPHITDASLPNYIYITYSITTGTPPNTITTTIPNGTWNTEMGHGRLNAADAVTIAYDMYRQNQTETGTVTYNSSHHIYAGEDVTDIFRTNGFGSTKYTINAGARVTFHAPTGNAIHLEHGFMADANSVFVAELANDPCTNSHPHYKKPIHQPTHQLVYTQNSTDAHDIAGIKLYPNPAKDNVNISFTALQDEQVSFTLMNLLGQKMSETVATKFSAGTAVQTLSTQGLAPGFYFVEVKNDNGYHKFKFVKE